MSHHGGYLTLFPVVVLKPHTEESRCVGLKINGNLVLTENTDNGDQQARPDPG